MLFQEGITSRTGKPAARQERKTTGQAAGLTAGLPKPRGPMGSSRDPFPPPTKGVLPSKSMFTTPEAHFS